AVRRPGVRKLGQFPGPVADVVAIGPQRASVVVVDVARRGGIQVEYRDVVLRELLESCGEGRIATPVLHVELEIDQRGRDRCGVGGADHAAGGFSDAQVRGEKSDDVESDLRVLPGEVGHVRCVSVAEVVDDVAARGEHASYSQLAIAVLGTETLPGGEARD